jgi:DNA mismatch endonuclease (patch repair protein)
MRRGDTQRSHTQYPTTTPERSALMGRVRQRGTAPEAIVQAIVTHLGHAYSTNVRGIPGSPDIVAAEHRCAIFVHGCYWHRHPGCRASTTPTRNAEFWQEKFDANVRRDREKIKELRKLGYRVMIAWECETKSEAKRARLERRVDRFFRRGK